MLRKLGTVGGAALGAAAMYALDPDAGRRRRALLKDRAAHWSRGAGDAIEKTAHDLRNRTAGVAAEARAGLRREQVDDAVLAERVRERLGTVLAHPGSTVCVGD